MDVFRNPDEVIKEVEEDEWRREKKIDVADEAKESPENQDEEPEEGKD